jgi:hypothetical protein
MATTPSKKERNEIAVVSGFGVNENAIPSIKPHIVSIIRYPLAKRPCHFLTGGSRRLIRRNTWRLWKARQADK